MVKIIKYGQKRRITCKKCGTLLEFDKKDVKTIRIRINEDVQQIDCPVCNEPVIIN